MEGQSLIRGMTSWTGKRTGSVPGGVALLLALALSGDEKEELAVHDYEPPFSSKEKRTASCLRAGKKRDCVVIIF